MVGGYGIHEERLYGIGMVCRCSGIVMVGVVWMVYVWCGWYRCGLVEMHV